MEYSGAEILIQSLTRHNVEILFVYPGACVMPVLDRLYDNREIRRVLVRHEQGAVHAAGGYARLSHKPGVVLVTSGPGATNTVAGIADAYACGVPLVVVTGQVSSGLIGTDAFQEVDIVSITAPLTKWNGQVRNPGEIAGRVEKAFQIAVSGRPGPVLLDITKDAQTGKAPYRVEAAPSNPFAAFSSRSSSPARQPVSYPTEVIRALEGAEKEIVLLLDKLSGNFCPEEVFCSGPVLKSAIRGAAGFGLPAAIGATFAAPGKTICLVAGASEFQATLKELGVIKQESLDIKLVLINDYAATRFPVRNPGFVQIARAYGIRGEQVKSDGDWRGAIRKMLGTSGSYLLEISGSPI